MSASVLLTILVSACASDPASVGARVTHCCPTSDYLSFSVQTADMPAFLGPVMVSNFSVAFAEHGLEPVSSVDNKPSISADLTVTLRYEQEMLGETQHADDFAEHIAPGGNQRFLARIVVEIRETGTSPIIWSGLIQRIHDVAPGEYMHTGKASIPLLDAFRKILADYPQRPDKAR